MKKIFTILPLALVVLVGSVQAENINKKNSAIYIHTGGFSKHFDSRDNGQKYNEIHNNFGLEFESRFDDLNEFLLNSKYFAGDYYYNFIGTYVKNSLDKDSIFLGAGVKKKWHLDWNENWQLGVGFFAGFQNGYPKASKNRDEDDFLPVAYPVLEITYKKVGVYGTCVPELIESGFCFLGFKLTALEF